MKQKIAYVCQECGYESPAFMGKCPECDAWNSLKEINITPITSSTSFSRETNVLPALIKDVKYEAKNRIYTTFDELDTVLGGGIVPGSVILLAGDPGIGKSTLLLQIAINLGVKKTVLYVSGEESEEQIKLRATRLSKNLLTNKLLLISITNTDAIVETIAKLKPDLVVIDSIQTMESENLTGLSGSVGQVRYATAEFIKVAKTLNIPVIIVGHVTKEGMVAGPMILSHMVDTVLFLEGEKYTKTRLLRSLKNRFGPVDEVGVFNMSEKGMEEVKNPEQIFLTENINNAPGSVLVVTLEGTRTFLVEIQALVVYSKLPMPRHVASGIDGKRLELLLAVLQKHGNLNISAMDVFVNVAGGLKLNDPAADLGICLAIFSSLRNIPLTKTVGIAEVGLLGELRKNSDYEKRIKEARKMGFTKILGADKYKNINQVLNLFK